MNDTFFGIVLTAINNKPYKFSVKGLNLKANSADPLSREPYAYLFTDESNIKNRPKKNFDLKVTSTLIDFNFNGISNELHNQSIRFGLRAIQEKPSNDKFTFDKKSYDIQKNEDIYQGEDLRLEILKFIYLVNSQWPSEGVGVYDLLDNFLNDQDELKNWTKALYGEGLIEPLRGFKQFGVGRKQVKSHGYIIKPTKREEVKKLFERKVNEKYISDATINPIKVFMSYSTTNKRTAGSIREELSKVGIDVFVAHDDINVSEEWKIRILHELKNCDIFLALITKKFKESDWTAQEAGIAIGKKKKIISLCATGHAPYGFLADYQAKNVKTNSVDKACSEILKDLSKDRKLKKRYKHYLIRKLSSSKGFTEAIEISSIIRGIDNFEKKELIDIDNCSNENDQIYNAPSAISNLQYAIKRNKDVLSNEEYIKMNLS